MSISPVPLKSPCQVHATFTPHTQQTVNRFPLPLSQDTEKTLVLMWLANFGNDASSMVHLRSSPWHIPCQPYGRLSIVVHYPSVSIRAAQSGLQSAPACRMRWVCHHLFRSYDRSLSNIANIRLHSVSGHTICCKDTLFICNYQIIREENNIKHINSDSVSIRIISPKDCKRHCYRLHAIRHIIKNRKRRCRLRISPYNQGSIRHLFFVAYRPLSLPVRRNVYQTC